MFLAWKMMTTSLHSNNVELLTVTLVLVPFCVCVPPLSSAADGHVLIHPVWKLTCRTFALSSPCKHPSSEAAWIIFHSTQKQLQLTLPRTGKEYKIRKLQWWLIASIICNLTNWSHFHCHIYKTMKPFWKAFIGKYFEWVMHLVRIFDLDAKMCVQLTIKYSLASRLRNEIISIMCSFYPLYKHLYYALSVCEGLLHKYVSNYAWQALHMAKIAKFKPSG